MKLIMAIIHERDKQKASDALLQAGHKFTIIASTGGFLRDGNTTFLIGAEDDQLDDAISTLSSCCSAREQFVNQPPPDAMGAGGMLANPVRIKVGGAVIFVVDVERFESV